MYNDIVVKCRTHPQLQIQSKPRPRNSSEQKKKNTITRLHKKILQVRLKNSKRIGQNHQDSSVLISADRSRLFQKRIVINQWHEVLAARRDWLRVKTSANTTDQITRKMENFYLIRLLCVGVCVSGSWFFGIVWCCFKE